MQVLKENEDEERKKEDRRRENYERNLLRCTQCNFVGPKELTNNSNCNCHDWGVGTSVVLHIAIQYLALICAVSQHQVHPQLH